MRIVIVVWRRYYELLNACFLSEQPKLICAQLLAAECRSWKRPTVLTTAAFYQVARQIDKHLLRDCGITGQAVEVDRH